MIGGIALAELTLVDRNWSVLEHLRHVEEDRRAGVPELTLAELELRLNAMLAEMPLCC
jgi:hypothetical protein